MHAKRFAIAVAICALLGTAAWAFIEDVDKDVARVYEQNIVLPMDGSNVTLYIWAWGGDMLIPEVFLNNTPTLTNGLCAYVDGTGPGDPIECSCSSYRVVRSTIDFSDYGPGGKPNYFAEEDRLATRTLVGHHESIETAIPLKQGSLYAVTFDTTCTSNPVQLKATVGVFGARAIVYAEASPEVENGNPTAN